MESRIQEIAAVRVTVGREKLVRDDRSVRKIFEVLERCTIPCECMAVNVDCFAIVVRKAEQGKIDSFIEMLGQELAGTAVSIDGEIRLLYIERGQFSSRRIGLLVSALSMQGVDIHMQRYIRCEDRFVVGVPVEDVDRARQIVEEVLVSDYSL